ncbi:PrGVORF63 [Pieris rapae granulovirus Wuhan]|uniref:PrGVORF63 n=1 Tax=Pieris rapae granulovirus Wuhan TaxID=2848030 RepID=D2J4N0_9BBAC|nr:PrGVORF63 [Betabaculovirus arrapae]ACZ63549.1 PrGVORF63 [Betabaculovirus arrapae]ADO85491.1 unknown [Pieris rapae granulovirus]UOS85738.1 ORF63 [Pieris rapae granulovirus]
MKRFCSEEEIFKKIARNEQLDEEYLINRVSYFVSNEPIMNTSVKLIVRVINDNMFTTQIQLVEGDTNLFDMSNKDILKYLLRKYKKLLHNTQHTVYVLI